MRPPSRNRKRQPFVREKIKSNDEEEFPGASEDVHAEQANPEGCDGASESARYQVQVCPQVRPQCHPGLQRGESLTVEVRAHDWFWWGIGHWKYIVSFIDPSAMSNSDASYHDSFLMRFSDLGVFVAMCNACNAFDESCPVPVMPPSHNIPLIGRYFDGKASADERASDIEVFVTRAIAKLCVDDIQKICNQAFEAMPTDDP